MAIELEFFSLTGMVGNTGDTGLLFLKHPPSTGPNGYYDIAVDPTDGPAQKLSGPIPAAQADYGVTHAGATGAVAFDYNGSSIKDVLLDTSHGVTGPLKLRVLYNYET